MEDKSDGGVGERSLTSPWNGPRTVIIPRTERGFGFTLRHFIVYPPEPKEREYISEDEETEELYFQRIQQGNLEPLDTIFVKNVKDGGPAYKAGLHAGDRIISVNGEPVTGKSYGQVINLIQQSSADLSLLVVPKEEDILQLAYQNSTSSYDSDYGSIQEGPSSSLGSRGLNSSQYPYPSSMDAAPYSSSRDRDRKVLSTSSLDSRYSDGSENFSRFEREAPRKTLTASTSYTSGLSIYREPPSDDNMNKALFLDRRREFEARAAQENVNPNVSKTYSFGLYFPKKDTRGNSAENLTKSVIIRRSRESVLQPTDSQENITKTRSRNVPIEYRHSGTPDQKTAERFRSQEILSHDLDNKSPSHHGTGSSIRHSFPDSGVKVWTGPSRRTSETASPYGHTEYRTATPDNFTNKRESYAGSTRQYVPVINESSMARNQKMSASVDSIDPRSNVFHSEHQLRTAFNNSQTEQNNQNQSSPSRTFIVKIEDSKERAATPNIVASPASSQSYGAAFALTRSPATTEIEIRQKSEPRILVSHRKKQFEKPPRGENTPSPNGGQGRYKSEIEKMTFRKYEGVQSRLASFEKQERGPGEPLRSRSQTPVSAQPISKVRRLSQERIKSPEPLQNTSTQGTSQSNYGDSAPIRIYVSQGNSNNSGSPIVEIVPVQSSNYDLSSSRGQGQYVSHGNQTEQLETDGSQKPVRKASFLSAVNAPYSRYLPDTGYENETPGTEVTPKSSRIKYSSNQNLREGSATPTNFQWTGQSPARAISPTSMVGSTTSITITSASVSPTNVHEPLSVRLRAKPEISAEDMKTKLHRRTSYLMATAKDRSAVSLTMSPSGGQPLDPSTPATLSKHKSMRKLKDFFGEKTPKIVEAQERKQDPASPIQQVSKEGNLAVKMDMLDGKKATDRSWRTFWAVLRAHALFLLKEKRDPANYVYHAISVKVRVGSHHQQPNLFSYEEQPISVKSCIVDIAHGYTKKKNVFRVKTYNGSEYLFQADDHEEMISWIEAIKLNSNPDEDTRGIASAELIIRKSQEVEESAAPIITKTSPPQTQKMTKKLSVLSIKQKIPHSPNLKRRKTTSDKDDSGKPKTWKGKIGKSFRRLGSSPAAPGGTIPSVQEVGGTFGVPLEDCTPSPNNEFVPLLVDLCTQIVEARGLEMTGVYRIPGNKAGVTMLQEEFNKGIDAMNLDLDKWSDINVISSLLKAFFRELPEPLIPDDLYQPFIDANRQENPERRMLKLKKRIHELLEHHFETFKHLAKHLNKVAQYGDVNRMEAKNLAIVFGPSLIRKADDNMIAMVTDMSDHCKIIESIILHCEWFFGGWDMDNYVPTEEDATECTSIMSGQTGSSREDLDSINPKEIVSSIVEAANRKMKGEDTITDKRSVSISEPPPKYNERNIDQEILFRRKIDATSRSSPNITVMQRSSEVLQSSASDLPLDRRMAKSQDFERDLSDFEYMDADKESSTAYLTPTTRYFSDESLLDKNDELEMSHGSQGGNYRLSRETLNSLRRIELEARALREREERRQRDLEKRKLEKQRIEQDILQTQQELEIEDRHSVEDLLNAQYSQYGFSDYYNNKRKLETDLLRNSGNKSSSGRKPVSSAGKYSVKESPSGGKYFVIKGNTQSVRGERSSRQPRQTSVESLVSQSKRTGSLENMADGQSHARPLVHVHARKGDHSDRKRGDGIETKRRLGGLSRSGSMRRGSLDSLIDLIEKRDNRMSWASTDSEDGYDLLTQLTSTFDQKLQTLSSQKIPQITPPTSAARHMSHVTTTASKPAVQPQSSPAASTSHEPPADTPTHTAQSGLPPQVPLSMMNRHGSNTDLPAKQYRDPSLHRTPPKSDAKIGLATRFERSTTYNPIYSDGRNTQNYNLQSDLTYTVENATVNLPVTRLPERPDVDTRVSSVMVVISSPSVMSADSRHRGSYSSPQFVSKPVMSSVTLTSPLKWEPKTALSPNRTGLDYRPITKSEKTEVNVKLSKSLNDKNRNEEIKNRALSQCKSTDNTGKSRSASPPPSIRDRKNEKRKRRRHTVGGTNDSEHMDALREASSKEQRLSAWEQLRPVVSESSNIGPSSSMMTWLRNERIRGSNPDLLSNHDVYNTPRKN